MIAPWPVRWPKEIRCLAAVVPHPDDEVFFAGFIRRAVLASAPVVLIAATRGERGQLAGRDAPAALVAETRSAELETSARLLGVTQIEHLDLPDGSVDALEHQGALRAALDRVGADAVVSFDVDGAYGHRDHVAIAEILAAAPQRFFRAAFPAGLFDSFSASLRLHAPSIIVETSTCTSAPRWELELDDDLRVSKTKAIAAHASQLRSNGTFLFRALHAQMLERERYRE